MGTDCQLFVGDKQVCLTDCRSLGLSVAMRMDVARPDLHSARPVLRLALLARPDQLLSLRVEQCSAYSCTLVVDKVVRQKCAEWARHLLQSGPVAVVECCRSCISIARQILHHV